MARQKESIGSTATPLYPFSLSRTPRVEKDQGNVGSKSNVENHKNLHSESAFLWTKLLGRIVSQFHAQTGMLYYDKYFSLTTELIDAVSGSLGEDDIVIMFCIFLSEIYVPSYI